MFRSMIAFAAVAFSSLALPACSGPADAGADGVTAAPSASSAEAPQALRKVWACTLVNGSWYCRWIYIQDAAFSDGTVVDTASSDLGVEPPTIQKPGH